MTFLLIGQDKWFVGEIKKLARLFILYVYLTDLAVGLLYEWQMVWSQIRLIISVHGIWLQTI